MKLNELDNQAPKRHIVLLSGKLCSGKGTYCSNVLPGYTHVSVSDIVKSISGFNKRSELHTTKDLDTQIADELISIISHHNPIVIDGIRQLSIVKRIQDAFGDGVDLQWLDVPQHELERRYNSRQDKKDDQDFNTALQRDRDLGLDDVEQHFRQHGTIIDNA